jgi:hypothetical protein
MTVIEISMRSSVMTHLIEKLLHAQVDGRSANILERGVSFQEMFIVPFYT